MEFVILVGIGLLISIGLLAFFIAKGIAKKSLDSNQKQVKASTKVHFKEPYSTIRFRYRDREGNETERTVDVVTGKRGETFRAFCHLRDIGDRDIGDTGYRGQTTFNCHMRMGSGLDLFLPA